MIEKRQPYRSYLLRVWEASAPDGAAPSTARFVVETVTGEPRRWVFASFDALTRFLRAEFRHTGYAADDAPPHEPGTPAATPPHTPR